MSIVKDKIVSVRMTDAEFEFFKERIGNTMPSEFARKLLLTKSASTDISTKLILIHVNQKEMSKLSNENKALWREIRQELGIE